MSNRYTLEITDDQALRWFSELLRRSGNLEPLMGDIAELLLESTQERARRGVAPDGTPWAPLKDGSGRTPLHQTGRMLSDIMPGHGPDFVELVAGAKQALWHQLGTDAFVIRPKNKKALAWPGGPGPRGQVNHPGLPARPFFGISAEDDDMITRIAGEWLLEE